MGTTITKQESMYLPTTPVEELEKLKKTIKEGCGALRDELRYYAEILMLAKALITACDYNLILKLEDLEPYRIDLEIEDSEVRLTVDKHLHKIPIHDKVKAIDWLINYIKSYLKVLDSLCELKPEDI